MPPLLSPSLNSVDTRGWLATLTGLLRPGEELVAVARIATFFPSGDHLAVTSSRLLVFQASSIAARGAVVEVAGSDISSVSIDQRLGGRTLLLHSGASEPRRLGVLQKVDCEFVVTHANHTAASSSSAQPTVAVYDPFTMPLSSAPDVASDVAAGPNEPPPAKQISSPSDSSDQPLPMRSAGAVEPDRRLVPRWKTVPAYLVTGFFAIGIVTSAFEPTIGLAGVLIYGALALIPILAVTRARFNAAERRAESMGARAEHGTMDRNWLPLGVPLIILLFVAGVAVV